MQTSQTLAPEQRAEKQHGQINSQNGECTMKHTIPGVLPQNHTQETLSERIAFVPSHCLPGKSVDSSPVQKKNNGESKLNPFHRATERRVWQVCRR